MVRDTLILIGYAVGWVLTALWLAWPPRGDGPHEDNTFAATVLGLLWPLWLAMAAALTPFVVVGWLVSRVTRGRA